MDISFSLLSYFLFFALGVPKLLSAGFFFLVELWALIHHMPFCFLSLYFGCNMFFLGSILLS